MPDFIVTHDSPEAIILERMKLAAKEKFDGYPYLSYNLDVEALIDELQRITVRLSTEVLSYVENSSKEIEQVYHNTVTRPRFASPWEHFKAKYSGRAWMSWYVKRNPVKFVEEQYPVSVKVKMDLQEFLTFPAAKRVWPIEMGKPIMHINHGTIHSTWQGPVDN